MGEIKNLSQLKKALVVGAKFTFTDHWRSENVGHCRMVTKTQTNGVYAVDPDDPNAKASTANHGKGMWFDFGKASMWMFQNGICTYADPHFKECFYSIKMI